MGLLPARLGTAAGALLTLLPAPSDDRASEHAEKNFTDCATRLFSLDGEKQTKLHAKLLENFFPIPQTIQARGEPSCAIAALEKPPG